MKKRPMTLSIAAAAALVSIGVTAAIAQGGSGGGGGGTATSAGGADLQITGSASTGSPAPGSLYNYTFQIKNNGNDTATGVTFSDPLPAELTLQVAVLNGDYTRCRLEGNNPVSGASIVCDVGSLAKGSSATVGMQVAAPVAPGTTVNTATVTSTSVDPNTSNNSASVSTTVKAPKATSTSGCKGGACDATQNQVTTPCAVLTAVSAPVGYYLTNAAVWNTFTISSCSSVSETVSVQITETNVATGSVDFDFSMSIPLTAGQNVGQVIDNDFAPFDTTYDISYTVRDSSGNVLNSASVQATTPPPR